MTDAFADFEWTVAPRYEWQDWLDASGKPVIVSASGRASFESCSSVECAWKRAEQEQKRTGPVLGKVPLSKGAVERQYCPMTREHAALFRTFAGLPYRDTAAILAFSTKYGQLGLRLQQQTAIVRNKSGTNHDHVAYGESHLAWAREICQMREGLRLAALLEDHGGHQASFEHRRRLKALIDAHVQDVRGRLTFDRAGDPRLVIEPLTLVAAMWLQLASAVSEGKGFVKCKFCARLFEISTEATGFRRHREFCSDSCKTKDYRRRKRTVLRLADNIVSVAAISDRSGTAKATVKKWLSASSAGAKGKK